MAKKTNHKQQQKWHWVKIQPQDATFLKVQYRQTLGPEFKAKYITFKNVWGSNSGKWKVAFNQTRIAFRDPVVAKDCEKQLFFRILSR